jgi:hypothetical protein
MHDHARRFVDHEQPVILVDDAQRDILADDISPSWRRLRDGYFIARPKAVARLLSLPANGDVSVGNQRR